MAKQCVINNCCNSSSLNKKFKFPFKDSQLLAKWLQEIPKSKYYFIIFKASTYQKFVLDLYTEITNLSYICVNHFESNFIRETKRFTGLYPNAVPSIFLDSISINLDFIGAKKKMNDVDQK